MRRVSKLPNTETDIFELSSHAWSWRVFGRSELVIFMEKTSHVGINLSMETVVWRVFGWQTSSTLAPSMCGFAPSVC